jgi:hypothetical protein
MALDSTDIKRQILADSEQDRTKVRKRIQQVLGNRDVEGEILEIGAEFEKLVASKGWTHIEVYMLRRMNLVGLAFNDKPDDGIQKGIARGYIELMQYVDQMIKARKEIIEEQGTTSKTDDS